MASAKPLSVQVFVDMTGRRHRRFTWGAVGLTCSSLFAVGLFWVAETGPLVGPHPVPAPPPAVGHTTGAPHADPITAPPSTPPPPTAEHALGPTPG